MEGPTTSSAIFYGSLSVHIGVFLLLRTFPIWEKDDVFRGLVLGVGLLTSAMATFTARVQSTVKTQIAYASIAQIGLMFAEVALGLHHLAMVHFVANAFLRCYQLLVSPSVLSYLIHDQFFHFVQPQHRFSDSFWGKMRATVFVLSIKEWNVDTSLRRYLWQPLKQAGGVLGKIPARGFAFVVVPILLAGFYLVFDRETLPIGATAYLPTVMAVIGTVIGLKAFTDRGSAHSNWLLVVANQLFSALSMGLNAEFETEQIFLFLSGIVVSAVVGLWCIERLRRAGEPVLLDRFRGHAFYWPRLSLVFVLACLGMSGFPITPTFIGEDLLLGKIDETQLALLGFTALSLILDGLAVFRIYARLFLGPNEKGYHEVAFKSS
jgi:NADH:ubiquinone oxidoreductase subunit 5 (subunit L)/multisubunit Na+/H+ antiporter MnhA subunit